jgi:hypothetical protein
MNLIREITYGLSCTMKLKELLKEWRFYRWYNQPEEQRFLFNTEKERYQFILKLNEINAEYYLYNTKAGFFIEVFL